MPGLLRGVARTAVVAGTATAVSNRVSRRQANRWAGQEQVAYAQQDQLSAQDDAAAASDTDETIAQLRELAGLKESGVLTQAEFEAQKAKVLSR